MKRTSPFSKLVSNPASSPAFSITGPLVFLIFTSISRAMMLASVVLPSPGGPLNRICWSTSSRFFAAATKSSSLSQILVCPVNSLNIGGRSETSKAGSGSGGFMCSIWRKFDSIERKLTHDAILQRKFKRCSDEASLNSQSWSCRLTLQPFSLSMSGALSDLFR